MSDDVQYAPIDVNAESADLAQWRDDLDTVEKTVTLIGADVDDLSAQVRAVREELSFTSATSQPKMTAKIATAIAQVMGRVKSLAADAKNQFARYEYTSVDKFYEAVGPLMAEAGLVTILFERSTEVIKRMSSSDNGGTKESTFLKVVFDIFLYHTSGEEFGPIQRETQVTAGAAQSFAAAESFVQKYFLRSLFKVPTGDTDPEEIVSAPQRRDERQDAPQAAPRGRQTVSSGKREEAPREPSLTDDASATLLASLMATLKVCESREAIVKWSAANSNEKGKLSGADQAKLKTAFGDQQAAVKAATTAQAEAAPAPEEKLAA
jgi:hypothetical protein